MNFTKVQHHLGGLMWAAVFYGILAIGWFATTEHAIDHLEGRDHDHHEESNP